jgi:hypothetical protein
VEDAATVGILERTCDIAEDDEYFIHRKCTVLRETTTRGLAFDERHRIVGDAVGIACSEERNDVGMLKLSDEMHLANKPFQLNATGPLWIEDLDHNSPAEVSVPGQEHPCHATAAEFTLDSVRFV